MVIRGLINEIKAMLNENAEFEASEIVMYALGIDRNDIVFRAKREVSQSQADYAFALARRRLNGEPLQYIIGSTEFMSLKFKLSTATLIPRSDTETLVEEILKFKGKLKVLDIGTGSGCIGISIGYYNRDCDVTLADISRQALDIAKLNADNIGVKVNILNIDIMKEYPLEKYDIIVSNPPYIKTNIIPTLQKEVKNHEPISALDGGEDGLVFYRRITQISPYILNPNGKLFYEIGFDQAQDVFKIMEESFYDIHIVKDLCGMDRVVYGTLNKIDEKINRPI